MSEKNDRGGRCRSCFERIPEESKFSSYCSKKCYWRYYSSPHRNREKDFGSQYFVKGLKKKLFKEIDEWEKSSNNIGGKDGKETNKEKKGV